MGEGVSLSIPRYGFLLGSGRQVPIYTGGDLCSSPKGTIEVAPRKANGCRDASSYGAGHALPMSGQQVPGFIGSGEPDQERCGDKSRSWLPNLRKSDLLGSDSRGPNPVEGVIKGDIGGWSLVPYTGAMGRIVSRIL